MSEGLKIRTLSSDTPPLRIARNWPDQDPLIMIHSGRLHPRWARWSILARPRAVCKLDRDLTWTGNHEAIDQANAKADPLSGLDCLLATTSMVGSSQSHPLPFQGGWIGYISYDLGRVIEPAAEGDGQGAECDRSWPLIELAWCPDALVYDNLEGQWYEVGEVPQAEDLLHPGNDREKKGCEVGTWTSSLDPDAYLTAVQRTLGYIAAGDIYQASITQRFSADFCGSPRTLFQAAMHSSEAWYGAYLEFGDDRSRDLRRVISISPELFLQYDPLNRTILTRPIKGTRPHTATPSELLDSLKDQAELNMIVDLMRNDLGRVCEFGTVKVPIPRTIESHPTVHHGVGHIIGQLRSGLGAGEMLRATFPGGSVTGAPKIRAMQIIDELEPVQRGPYCGAIGWFSDCGAVRLNIAIRTLLLSGQRIEGSDRPGEMSGTLDYACGGGIVADSDPIDEYHECLDKARVLRLTLQELARQDQATPTRMTSDLFK